MKVKICKERGSYDVKFRERLERICNYGQKLAGLGEEPGLLQVIIISPETMAEMNGQFLQHEGRTDVLTFDLREEGLEVTEEDVVGEIYVCPEVALEYSAKFGTTPSWELVLYMIHGMLHLAGEDDLDDEARLSMRAAEARVMEGLKKRYSLEGFIQ